MSARDGWFAPRAVDHDEPQQEYWLSYSDLLAGLLMVFTLLLLVSLYQYESRVSPVRQVLVTRDSVVGQLREVVADSLIVVQEDGRIRFGEGVLFDFNQAVILPEGDAVLRRFAERYLPLVFGSAAVRRELEAIVIEGHTDVEGPYEVNLGLSQRRAFAVMEKLLLYGGEWSDDLRLLATANGRAFAELVCRDGSTDLSGSADTSSRCGGRELIDDQASRRIEIRFQLRDEEMLRALVEQFSR